MTSPMMTYGGEEHKEESTFGGLCPPGQELNWFMVIVVLLLMFFIYHQYTTEGFYVDYEKDAFKAPEDAMEYFVPEELVYGDRNL